MRRFAGASARSLVALRTDEELDDYTYRVAGCVGEFWTKMCRAHLFPEAPVDDAFLLANGVRFGKGLQLVNILRDVAADLRQGRCYLPAERLAELGLKPADLLQPANEPRLRPLYHGYLDRAEAHLLAGWAYTNALPRGCVRVRLACAWPILIGRETLKLLRAGNAARPGAANQSQPARGPAAHAAVGAALSLAAGMGKDGSGRESCCVARPFAVKRPPCRFQNPSWSSARRRFAQPCSRFARLTPTQNKLREALEKKLNELQTQPPAAAPQAAPVAPKPAKPAAPAPAAAPVPAARQRPPRRCRPGRRRPSLVAPPPVDSESIAKAREALREKMKEMEAQPAQATPQPVVVAPPPERTPAPRTRPAPATTSR